MADGFSDVNLFAEFERTPERTDKLLLSRCNADTELEFDHGESNVSDEDKVDSNEDPSYRRSDVLHGRDIDVEDAENVDGKYPETESGRQDTNTDKHVFKSTTVEMARLKAELHKLRKQCERLKRHNRLISTSKYGKLDEGPIVQVIYMNNALSGKCKAMIESVVSSFVHERHAVDVGSYLDKRITPSSMCLEEDEDDAPVPDEKLRQIRTSTVIGCTQIYQQFIIDTMGWPLSNYNPVASEGWEGPVYKQVFHVSLGDCEEEKENSCPQKIRRLCCFNCDGDHSIKDCKEPYNSAQVALNKQKFRNESQSMQKQNSRYHVIDPKFSKFKPGCISEELRKAMGLSDDQLPLYIYNMRKLGYPPGHLQALTDNSSGITMFGEDGRELTLDGEPVEEGEVDASIPNQKCTDVTKIIEYPGFNVPAKGVKDECRKLGMPEFSTRQSKERLAEYLLQQNRGVKRPSNGNEMPKYKRTKKGEDITDMELADADVSHSLKNDDTMTLEELQKQKELIKQQLALAEGNEADPQILDAYENEELFEPPLPPTPVRPSLPEDTLPVTPAVTTCSDQDGTPLFKTPGNSEQMHTPSTGNSLSMSLGTPVMDYGKGVPEPEKFSRGIQQDIPFENLPGATGTFERVKKVLARLRSQEDGSS